MILETSFFFFFFFEIGKDKKEKRKKKYKTPIIMSHPCLLHMRWVVENLLRHMYNYDDDDEICTYPHSEKGGYPGYLSVWVGCVLFYLIKFFFFF